MQFVVHPLDKHNLLTHKVGYTEVDNNNKTAKAATALFNNRTPLIRLPHPNYVTDVNTRNRIWEQLSSKWKGIGSTKDFYKTDMFNQFIKINRGSKVLVGGDIGTYPVNEIFQQTHESNPILIIKPINHEDIGQFSNDAKLIIIDDLKNIPGKTINARLEIINTLSKKWFIVLIQPLNKSHQSRTGNKIPDIKSFDDSAILLPEFDYVFTMYNPKAYGLYEKLDVLMYRMVKGFVK